MVLAFSVARSLFTTTKRWTGNNAPCYTECLAGEGSFLQALRGWSLLFHAVRTSGTWDYKPVVDGAPPQLTCNEPALALLGVPWHTIRLKQPSRVNLCYWEVDFIMSIACGFRNENSLYRDSVSRKLQMSLNERLSSCAAINSISGNAFFSERPRICERYHLIMASSLPRQWATSYNWWGKEFRWGSFTMDCKWYIAWSCCRLLPCLGCFGCHIIVLLASVSLSQSYSCKEYLDFSFAQPNVML